MSCDHPARSILGQYGLVFQSKGTLLLVPPLSSSRIVHQKCKIHILYWHLSGKQQKLVVSVFPKSQTLLLETSPHAQPINVPYTLKKPVHSSLPLVILSIPPFLTSRHMTFSLCHTVDLGKGVSKKEKIISCQ